MGWVNLTPAGTSAVGGGSSTSWMLLDTDQPIAYLNTQTAAWQTAAPENPPITLTHSGNGRYTVTVPGGWDGATDLIAGYGFTPESLNFVNDLDVVGVVAASADARLYVQHVTGNDGDGMTGGTSMLALHQGLVTNQGNRIEGSTVPYVTRYDTADPGPTDRALIVYCLNDSLQPVDGQITLGFGVIGTTVV